jgi:transposase InsO family protein
MSTDTLIHAAASELLAAPHGSKGRIAATLAEQMGCSVHTAYRHLSAVMGTLKPRKRRADAGELSLSRDEARDIAALVEETRRLTGTGTLPVEDAVEILRANGRILAACVDKGTGEYRPLSTSSICRAIRHYGFHRDQLAQPSPAARLSSPHPNYLWQVDASVSRQFYLADDGMQVMGKREFYRGKPQNFTKIADRRLWRYVVTDHASGCIEVFYVLGAESSANLLSALIHAMTLRPDGTMHGIPKMLMTDPGSAMTAGSTRNFIAATGIELIINQVGNARAKGQVENANYLVEIHFEAALKTRAPVTSLEEINTLAQQWARAYNATRMHTRTGMTRRDGWLRIRPEELVLAPPMAVLRQLATSAPKACTVRDGMVRFRGQTFNVRGIPGLVNHQRVSVVANALDPEGSVRVLMPGERDTAPIHYVAPRIGQDDWGFLSTAAQVGAEFKALPETPADAARKELDRVAMEVQTDAEAAAARKAKRLPFGGNVDPHKHIRELVIAPSLPRAGTASRVSAPEVVAAQRIEPAQVRAEIAPLNHVEAAMRLKPLVERSGTAWLPEMYARTATRWPDGVPVDEIEAWAVVLATPERGGLRVIGGGAA